MPLHSYFMLPYLGGHSCLHTYLAYLGRYLEVGVDANGQPDIALGYLYLGTLVVLPPRMTRLCFDYRMLETSPQYLT